MDFLSLGLRVVVDRSCQSCSGMPGEHIFSKRVLLIFRECILTTLACYINALVFIIHSIGRPRPSGVYRYIIQVLKSCVLCKSVVYLLLH